MFERQASTPSESGPMICGQARFTAAVAVAASNLLLTLWLWYFTLMAETEPGRGRGLTAPKALFLFSIGSLIVLGHRVRDRAPLLGMACLAAGYGLVVMGFIVPWISIA